MLHLETAQPHPLLARCIRAYVQRDFRMCGTETAEPVVARLGMMLEFQFQDPYRIPSFTDNAENPCSPVTIIGPISHRRVRLIVRGNVSALAVIFEPSGFHHLFGVPALSLAERGTEGHAVLGANVSTLHEQLGNAATFAQRVSLLNRFFVSRLHNITPRDSESRPGLLHTLYSFLRPDSPRTVAQVSRHSGISVRQLERKSLDHFGVSPSMLTRISRFQKALRMADRGMTPWLRIAHACGYHDQMHMVRDFHTFAGGPPSKSVAEIAPHHLIRYQ